MILLARGTLRLDIRLIHIMIFHTSHFAIHFIIWLARDMEDEWHQLGILQLNLQFLKTEQEKDIVVEVE
jgi:hypothetical protein